MIVRSEIRLAREFSLRSNINMRDVSHIFTDSITQTHQWHKLIFQRLSKQTTANATIHICPWDNDDWKLYLKLQDQVSQIVIWIDEDMKIEIEPHVKLQVVRYKSSASSERFVIVSGNEIGRALISWDQAKKTDDDSITSVFISSPTVAQQLSSKLSQKLTGA